MYYVSWEKRIILKHIDNPNLLNKRSELRTKWIHIKKNILIVVSILAISVFLFLFIIYSLLTFSYFLFFFSILICVKLHPLDWLIIYIWLFTLKLNGFIYFYFCSVFFFFISLYFFTTHFLFHLYPTLNINYNNFKRWTDIQYSVGTQNFIKEPYWKVHNY